MTEHRGSWSVLEDRRHVPRRLVAVVGQRALHPGPAVVLAAPEPAGAQSISSQQVWPDVADPQVAGLRVEGEPPGVAQPVRPDLGPRAPRSSTNGLSGGIAYGVAAARVDPQQLAEQRVEVLPVAVRVAAAAAVAETEVEHAVGART